MAAYRRTTTYAIGTDAIGAGHDPRRLYEYAVRAGSIGHVSRRDLKYCLGVIRVTRCIGCDNEVLPIRELVVLTRHVEGERPSAGEHELYLANIIWKRCTLLPTSPNDDEEC